MVESKSILKWIAKIQASAHTSSGVMFVILMEPNTFPARTNFRFELLQSRQQQFTLLRCERRPQNFYIMVRMVDKCSEFMRVLTQQ